MRLRTRRFQSTRIVLKRHIMNKTIAILIAASAMLLTGCSTTHHGTNWEYKSMSGASDSALNQMVEQGWSVAGFSEYASPSATIRRSYLLKRPKQ